MPFEIKSVACMVDCVVDSFPSVDMPQVFGLHPYATIKNSEDVGNDIMHQIYHH
jgi:hypothetical protein